MKCGWLYKVPFIYGMGIKLLHYDGFRKVKDFVEDRKKVFDVACGYGRLRKYLPKNIQYAGIDLNEKWIKHGIKKGRDLRVGDILEEKNYEKSDIIILCDILHHMTQENMRKLVQIATKFAKEKVIIMEPSFVNWASGKNPFSRFLAKIFSWVDNDGINKITKWHSKEDYIKLFQEFKEKNKFAKMRLQAVRQYYFVEFNVAQPKVSE